MTHATIPLKPLTPERRRRDMRARECMHTCGAQGCVLFGCAQQRTLQQAINVALKRMKGEL